MTVGDGGADELAAAAAAAAGAAGSGLADASAPAAAPSAPTAAVSASPPSAGAAAAGSFLGVSSLSNIKSTHSIGTQTLYVCTKRQGVERIHFALCTVSVVLENFSDTRT